MIEVHFKPSFIRQMNKLEANLVDEAVEKIALFKDVRNHKALKVHKLKGHLKNTHSFWVNYQVRIVFEYESQNEAVLLMIGDHDVYKA
mgnify:CR=1 FL=1